MSGSTLPVPVLHSTGAGRSVLLLHPLGVDRSFWDGVLPAFEGFDGAPPFTAAAAALAAALPDARLAWLSPARHAGVLEQPEQFAAAAVGFLRAGQA